MCVPPHVTDPLGCPHFPCLHARSINCASRMESSGFPDTVQVSGATHAAALEQMAHARMLACADAAAVAGAAGAAGPGLTAAGEQGHAPDAVQAQGAQPPMSDMARPAGGSARSSVSRWDRDREWGPKEKDRDSFGSSSLLTTLSSKQHTAQSLPRLATPRISAVGEGEEGEEPGPVAGGLLHPQLAAAAAAAQQLPEFQFVPLGLRPIKGKGLVSTFLVKVRKEWGSLGEGWGCAVEGCGGVCWGVLIPYLLTNQLT